MQYFINFIKDGLQIWHPSLVPAFFSRSSTVAKTVHFQDKIMDIDFP
jgi:hypothetical protein